MGRMAILKQKNRALEKNMQFLQEMNAELSHRVNATELAKNQIQKKLSDTLSSMSRMMGGKGGNKSSKGAKEKRAKAKTASSASPTHSLKEKVSGFGGMASSKINAMFGQNEHAQRRTPKNSPPKPPTK